MADILSLINPVELTEVARLARAEFDAQVQSYAQYLPYKGVNDIRYSYDKGAGATVDEALFRAFNAESPIGQRPAGARVTGEILPISRKIPLSEYAQLRARNASDGEIVDQHFADAANLAKGIAARTERARAQLLETGKVTINENGVVTEYDSGRAGANTPTALAGTAKWDAPATAKPISDIITWSNVIRNAVGASPTVLRVSAAVMANLQAAAEVRGAFTALANAPLMVGRDQVSQAFVALAGVRVEVDEPPAGMSNPRDPSKVVLLVDSLPVGATLYGTPVEAFEPQYTGVSSQPGIYAGVYKTPDPVTPWTKAVAIVLPILTTPDATLAVKVV